MGMGVITDQNMVEAGQRTIKFFEAVLRASADGIVITDATHTIVLVNDTFAALFGSKVRDMVETSLFTWLERFAGDAATSWTRMVDQTVLEGMYNEGGYQLVKGGQRLHFSVNASLLERVENEEPGIIVSIWRDVTAQKRFEAQLEKSNRELADSNRELEAFTYAVSHDLRAPLRAIDGFSRAVLTGYGQLLDEEGREYLHYVREGSREMGQLIDGLLRLSRSTRGELSKERFDFSTLAEEVIERLRRAEPQRRVACRITPGMVAYGDFRLLKTALENLLGNAWKYTSRQSDPHIEFGVDGRTEAVFQVRDNGAGFDMAYADQLFTPFKRLHDASMFSGSGIGLATVQRIIHRHGGRIWADAKVDSGATFYFTLPPEMTVS